MASLAEIYDWFMTGKKPTQAQFWASWGSFWNKNESIPQSAVSNLTNTLAAKTENTQFNAHKTDSDAHTDLFAGKEDITNKGEAEGYAPLNEFAQLAAQYLNIVNDLVTGGSTALLSAEQGKVLKTQIDAINTVLSSNDVNLDTVQELINAIKTVQTSLSTILVNDLTTGGTTKALTAEMGKLLQTNKVDKVAGERLINASEITKLGGLSNAVTTVKTILSTALATQDITGFVTYVNTLATTLVVGANEIVKYKTSDTGRVFELLLRGRSFGVGQSAITVNDVIEITEFLNKDIKLSNYPSTRNDGQLPTNKVLAPDVNGNLKLYTIATSPAPYLQILIPSSNLPNTTGDFVLKGSFFTPNMTVVITGQTVNYVTFISDNEVRANITTGSAEGYFAITLDNGISRTFNNALLIVLGTVFNPISSEWTTTGQIDVATSGEVNPIVYNSNGTAVWSKNIDYTKNFRVEFSFRKSQLGTINQYANANNYISLIKISDSSNILKFSPYLDYSINRMGIGLTKGTGAIDSYFYWANYGSLALAYDALATTSVSIRWVNGVLYVYINNVLKQTLSEVLTENSKIKVGVNLSDYVKIRYIETT